MCYALEKNVFQQVLVDVDDIAEGRSASEHSSMELRLHRGLERLPDCMVRCLQTLQHVPDPFLPAEFQHEGGFERRRVRNRKVVEMYHPELSVADRWRSRRRYCPNFLCHRRSVH